MQNECGAEDIWKTKDFGNAMADEWEIQQFQHCLEA
jgi:hypothetical protein